METLFCTVSDLRRSNFTFLKAFRRYVQVLCYVVLDRKVVPVRIIPFCEFKGSLSL